MHSILIDNQRIHAGYRVPHNSTVRLDIGRINQFLRFNIMQYRRYLEIVLLKADRGVVVLWSKIAYGLAHRFGMCFGAQRTNSLSGVFYFNE